MTHTKASRLKKLSESVPVPFFVCLKRGEFLREKFDADKRYMVRSSTSSEDQVQFSKAGRFVTYGPLEIDEVQKSVEKIFQDSQVDDVIVQEFIESKEYGVAFCFLQDKMLIEYSSQFEGVTSGIISPFTALLPCKINRYERLQKYLAKIYEQFGPSDVEFAGLEDPKFVQVRPITRSFTVDEEQVYLKMHLQEQKNSRWEENDVCRVIAERNHKSKAFIDMYTKGLKLAYKDIFKKDIRIPPKPFFRISDQYFMAEDLFKQLGISFWMMMRLGFLFPFRLAQLHKDTIHFTNPVVCMQYSILMSLAYDLFKKQRYFDLREKLRMKLDELLEEGVYLQDGVSSQLLGKNLEWDRKKRTWKHFNYRESEGVVVVEGDMHSGPYFRLKERDDEIPQGVVLVTEQLYPEIGKSIQNIKGIICRNGAMTSHVAILAREYKVPLVIQADIKKYD